MKLRYGAVFQDKITVQLTTSISNLVLMSSRVCWAPYVFKYPKFCFFLSWKFTLVLSFSVAPIFSSNSSKIRSGQPCRGRRRRACVWSPASPCRGSEALGGRTEDTGAQAAGLTSAGPGGHDTDPEDETLAPHWGHEKAPGHYWSHSLVWSHCWCRPQFPGWEKCKQKFQTLSDFSLIL